jgi:hypothetical protein
MRQPPPASVTRVPTSRGSKATVSVATTINALRNASASLGQLRRRRPRRGCSRSRAVATRGRSLTPPICGRAAVGAACSGSGSGRASKQLAPPGPVWLPRTKFGPGGGADLVAAFVRHQQSEGRSSGDRFSGIPVSPLERTLPLLRRRLPLTAVWQAVAGPSCGRDPGARRLASALGSGRERKPATGDSGKGSGRTVSGRAIARR